MAVNNQGPSGMASAATALKGILNETVGPMAVLTAGAMAFVKYTAGAALNAEKMAAALRASADAKRLEGQFKLIMGSADMARKKVAELSREAAKSPFSFQALGKAALNLQVLSQGAFASSRALKQVQDVAVATGTPVDAVAAAMGDLVGSLKRGGDGVGQAASQLASMGAITQQTAQKVADLAAKGAPMGEAMRLVEAETSKASGAAAELANTIDGLQQKMENLQTASDAKIGSMFEEGEKAGLRAAMGFQKFNNAVQEAASGPWAGLLAALNAVKESAGNLLGGLVETNADQTIKLALQATGLQDAQALREAVDGSGNDRVITLALQATGLENVQQLRDALDGVGQKTQGVATAFRLLSSASVAALFALLAGLGSVALAIGKVAVAALQASGAMARMGAALRLWGGLMAAGGAAALVAATGLVYFVTQTYEAVAAVKALSDALERQNKSGRESAANLRKRGDSMVTTEDKTAALQDADAQLEAARKEARDARAEKEAADKRLSEANNNKVLGIRTASFMEQESAAAAATNAEAKVNVADNNVARIERERQRIASVKDSSLGMDREQDQQARDRMDLEKRIKEDAYAQVQAAANPQAQAVMAKADYERAKQKMAKADKDSKVTYAQRQALNDATSKAAVTEQDAEKVRQGIEGIKGVTATTETARLSKELAIRETLQQQMADVSWVDNAATIGNRSPQEIAAAQAKKAVVEQQIASIGGAGEISGSRIQELQRQRDFAAKNEDPNAARAEEEAARNRAQAAKEAAAAEKTLLATKLRTFTLENQLSGVADDGANAEAKATAESENRAGALRTALEAAKALEQAQANYSASIGTGGEEAARKKMEEASVAAAAAGTGGRSVSELQNELNIEQQILQANIQQSKMQQAAAQQRVEAAMRQLNTERMIAQMNVESAKSAMQGTTGPQSQTQASIDSQAAQAEIAATEKALAAAKAKDAAEKAVVANPNEANARALDEANRNAAAAGVGNRTPEEIQADLQKQRMAEANREAQQAEAAKNQGDSMRVATLRAQEAYGPNRDEAKKAADTLEDEMAKRARAKELGQTIKDPQIAADLASLQVDQERAMKNIAEMGTQQVSEMARVGGSAGWAGLVNDPTKEIKNLQEIAKKQKDVLDKLDEKMRRGLEATDAAIAAAKGDE